MLNYFDTNFFKGGPFKESSQEPTYNKKFGRKKEVNAIVQHAIYYIIMQRTEKLIVKDETSENIGDGIDRDELYELNKLSL